MSALAQTPEVEFSAAEVEAFRRDGFVIVRGLAGRTHCAEMKKLAQDHLVHAVPPVEYEADVRYPGSPMSQAGPGGRTVRRLLQAYARDALFRAWALSPAIGSRLSRLLGAQPLLSQAHHNCVMTKDPRYSSRTGWHQDIRYWSFAKPELISVWLALGEETAENGCLQLVPGSHTRDFRRDQFDELLFFRSDLDENRALIDGAVRAELAPGDVLFFHSRLLHAAGWNRTAETKLSVVFTYHDADNHPLPDTRSASLPSVPMAA
ncbi:MAG TPA: phytanoyl-CoA dioxygenase family protein [Burkholderiales bacterium]|nr:phytanoyl-CoA dioxygenase family protein [Burkholderiales bacterium]